METIAVVLMVALFIILMVFVFSTALLTPILGKRNLLFVLAIGFVVGIIGGLFFIAPVVEDIPGLATSFYLSTSNSVETLNVDVSSNLDVNQFIENTRKLDGVKSVTVNGVTMKTAAFNDGWKTTFQNRIPVAVKGVKSVQIPSSDTLEVQIQDGYNTPDTVKRLGAWIMLVSGTAVRYSLAHATIQVESSKVYSVSNELSKDAVVKEVKGPTHDKINYIKSIIPNKFNVVLFCGVIGLLTGLAGVFVDTLIGLINNLKERVKKKEKG
ncbi:MAG: hypothetical protein ACXVHP_01655 [Methanobacterium sp.]